MIFFQLFNWFQLSFSENCFPKVARHSQNRSKMDLLKEGVDGLSYLNLPNNVWRLIVFAPFLIKSPKQSLRDLLFLLCFLLLFLFFLSAKHELVHADLRNYRTEFHETRWSYRYMFLVDPKVFRFVVNGVKVIFLGVQRGWGLL